MQGYQPLLTPSPIQKIRVDTLTNLFEWPATDAEVKKAFLGEGSFGAVHRLKCLTVPSSCSGCRVVPGKYYAVKTMSIKNLKFQKKFNELIDELDVYPTLNNVLYCMKFYDVFQDSRLKVDVERNIYLVLEHIQGMSLLDYCMTYGEKYGRIPNEDVALITKQLMYALDSLHRVGIIHRDIKLDNVMIKPATDLEPLRVKVIDFGFAKVHRRKQQTQQLLGLSPSTCDPGQTPIQSYDLGTNLYLCPEILEIRLTNNRSTFAPRHLSQTQDIYAVGVCIYAMLRNQFPYPERVSERELLRLKKAESIPHLSDIASYCPLGAAFVQAAMRSDPKDRPQAKDCLQMPWLQEAGDLPPPSPMPMKTTLAAEVPAVLSGDAAPSSSTAAAPPPATPDNLLAKRAAGSAKPAAVNRF